MHIESIPQRFVSIGYDLNPGLLIQHFTFNIDNYSTYQFVERSLNKLTKAAFI